MGDAYKRWFRGQYGDSEGSKESYDEYAGREPGYYELEMTDGGREERSEAQSSLTQEIDYMEGRIDLEEEVDKFMAAKAQEKKNRENELNRHIEHLVIAARAHKREAKWEKRIDTTKCTALIVFSQGGSAEANPGVLTACAACVSPQTEEIDLPEANPSVLTACSACVSPQTEELDLAEARPDVLTTCTIPVTQQAEAATAAKRSLLEEADRAAQEQRSVCRTAHRQGLKDAQVAARKIAEGLDYARPRHLAKAAGIDLLGKHSIKIFGPGKTMSRGLEGALEVIDEEQVLIEEDRVVRLHRLDGVVEEAVAGQVEDMDMDVEREALVEGQGNQQGNLIIRGLREETALWLSPGTPKRIDTKVVAELTGINQVQVWTLGEGEEEAQGSEQGSEGEEAPEGGQQPPEFINGIVDRLATTIGRRLGINRPLAENLEEAQANQRADKGLERLRLPDSEKRGERSRERAIIIKGTESSASKDREGEAMARLFLSRHYRRSIMIRQRVGQNRLEKIIKECNDQGRS